MAENYGGVDGHLRAQRAVPESQKKKALEEVEEEIKRQRRKYNSSRNLKDRQRAESDRVGAEEMRKKINSWETE